MKFKKVFLLFIIFLLGGVCGADSTGIKTGRNVKNRINPYGQVIKKLMALARTDSTFAMGKIGRSTSGGYPVYCCEVSGKTPGRDRLRVLIIGGIHGSEPAGTEALLVFLSKMADGSEKNRQLYLDNLELYIIPCLNPEGAAKALGAYRETKGFWGRDGRENNRGIDLNRDYHAVESREIESVITLYNRINPDVVLDLHEFSSIPIVVSGSGWWQAASFDLTVGAGRHPDLYGPMARYAVDVTENEIFPAVRKAGRRAEYYTVSQGNMDSTRRMAVNGADYFNLRNSVTFLVETAGYDRGESNLHGRIELHLVALRAVLDRVAKDREKIRGIVAEAVKFSLERSHITRSLQTIPRKVMIDGKPVENKHFETTVDIEGRTYRSIADVFFRRGDPDKAVKSPLPDYYVVFTESGGFIKRLILHGAKVYQAIEPIKTDRCTIPPGAFIVPVHCPSSAIIGLILDEKAFAENRFTIRDRALVFPVSGTVDLSRTKAVTGDREAMEAASKTSVYLLQKDRENNQ